MKKVCKLKKMKNKKTTKNKGKAYHQFTEFLLWLHWNTCNSLHFSSWKLMVVVEIAFILSHLWLPFVDWWSWDWFNPYVVSPPFVLSPSFSCSFHCFLERAIIQIIMECLRYHISLFYASHVTWNILNIVWTD